MFTAFDNLDANFLHTAENLNKLDHSYKLCMVTCRCLLCIRNYIRSLTSSTPKLALRSLTPKPIPRRDTPVIEEEHMEESNNSLLKNVRY